MSEGRTRSRKGTLTAGFAAALAAAFLALPALAQADGTISGTVTAQDTTQPFPGVRVCALNQGINGCAETASDGSYTIRGPQEADLPAGEYAILFSPPNGSLYVAEWYDGKNIAGADPVLVEDEAVIGVDASLRRGGTIEGVVTDASNVPIAGAEVCANSFPCDATDASGAYTLEGLEENKYLLTFRASGYVTEYYDGKSVAKEANLIAIQPEQVVSNVNAQLSKPAPPSEGPPPTQSQPPPPYPQIASQTTPPPRRKRCKKGFRRKKVRGHVRCVKGHRRRRAHRKHRAHRRHHPRRAQRRNGR